MTTATITDSVVTATVTDDTVTATIADSTVTATISGGLAAASESLAGALEIATSAEALALTATDKAIVPSVFYSAYSGSHGGHIDVTKSHPIATGTSSDQKALLETAINSITDNGDIAYIPGVIRVDDGLEPRANARIVGGPGATLQSLAVGVGSHILNPKGHSNVHIKGIKFLGVVATDATDSTDSAIVNQDTAASGWVIEYCEFDSFWARALRSNGVAMDRTTFVHNYVHDIKNLGVDLSYMTNGVFSFNLLDTVGHEDGDWAMYASRDAEGLLLQGNRVINSWAGLKVRSSFGTTNNSRIIGNEIYTTTGGDCIVVNDTGHTVANNTCYPASGRTGINCETATTDVIVNDNRIDLGGFPSIGISLENVTDGEVTDNQVRNGDGSTSAIGISIKDATNLLVSDNHLLSTGRTIQFSTANTFTRTHIVGNTLYGGGSGTTAIFGTGITALVDSAIRSNTFTNYDINIDFGSLTLTDVIITDNHAPDGVAGSRFIRATGMAGGVVANNIGNQAMTNFALGTLGTAVVYGNKSTSSGAFVTWANNDLTPAVDLGDSFICSHTGTVSITNFDNGAEGRTITVHFTTAGVTITDGTNIMLNGSTNYNAPAGTIMQFQLRSSVWYELSRVNT